MGYLTGLMTKIAYLCRSVCPTSSIYRDRNLENWSILHVSFHSSLCFFHSIYCCVSSILFFFVWSKVRWGERKRLQRSDDESSQMNGFFLFFQHLFRFVCLHSTLRSMMLSRNSKEYQGIAYFLSPFRRMKGRDLRTGLQHLSSSSLFLSFETATPNLIEGDEERKGYDITKKTGWKKRERQEVVV